MQANLLAPLKIVSRNGICWWILSLRVVFVDPFPRIMSSETKPLLTSDSDQEHFRRLKAYQP
jgi:hypothetical protein